MSIVSVKILGEKENVEIGWDKFKVKLEEKNTNHEIDYSL